MIKAEINFLKSLSRKQERIASRCFVAEGVKMAEEMLNSGFKVLSFYYTGVFEEDYSVLLKQAERKGTKLQKISVSEMERVSQLKTPASVLVVVEMPVYSFSYEDIKENLSLALDGVQDPGNLGTIVRFADWFGIRHIFCSPDCADLYNIKVVQATMGAISRVKAHYLQLESFMEEACEKGIPIYGTFLDGENIYKKTLSPSGIVVMGNEGRGISPGITALIKERLYIPPYPDGTPSGESLNVGIATAIICSEFRRRI